MNATCSASRHGTAYAARTYKCSCPEAVDALRARRRESRIPGRSRRGQPEQGVEAERLATVASLTRIGQSTADIAIRLGVADRTVSRYRARLRQSPTHRKAASA
jgi:DNA-binding NarL/FixJ family response regulator